MNYPTYSMNPNNQYQMNFANPNMQPQYDRMAQLQNYNQNLQQQFAPTPQQNNAVFSQPVPVGLNGKFIQTVENITANDVPMDGSVALFPMNDMSRVLAKAWQSDGTIKTVIYEPIQEQGTNMPNDTEKSKFDAFNEVLEGISEKVDTLANRIDEFMSKPKAGGRPKKEVIENE